MKRFVFVALLAGLGNQAAAIPVADTSTLAQTIADAALQAAQQAFIEKLDRELAERGIEVDEELAEKARELAKEQFEKQRDEDGYGWLLETGNTGFYGQHNELNKTGDGYINKQDDDLDSGLNNYQIDDSYREKHGLKSDNAYMQESYDKELKYRKMLDEAHRLNNERLERIEILKIAAGTVSTPQAKADIELVIQAEQAAILSENLRMQTINEMKSQEARLEGKRLNKAAYKALAED